MEQGTVGAGLVGWLRANPLVGRLAVKLAVVLPLGIAAGLLLSAAAAWFGLPQNAAAVGAALVALVAGLRLAKRVSERLGIPEP